MYLFDFFIRKVDNINIILRYLLLEITNKGLKADETPFNFFDKSEIQDFGNTVIVLY